MRRVLASVGGAGILLMSAACGGGGDGSFAQLTASDDASSSSAEEAAPSLPSRTTARPTPTPNGPATNARGNIEAALGTEGTLSDSGGGPPVATFAVDSVTPIECDHSYSSPPQNGTFVSVQLRVSTTAGLATSDLYLSISGYSFNFIGSSGVTVSELATPATYGCITDRASLFPSGPLGPGQQFVGQVILDVPEPTGALVFFPTGPYDGGWEVRF